jgi:hypothetical protein
MALDASTLLFIGVLVRLVAAGVALIAWYMHRDVVCLLGWSAAMFLSATAMVAGSFRGTDDAFSVALVAALLFVAGYALMWTSMRRFSDERLTPIRQALTVLAVTGVFALLSILAWHFGVPRQARSALFAVFIAGLTVMAALETWRGYRHDGLRSRYITAGALACIALSRLVRLGFIVLQSVGTVSPRTGELVQSYALYLTIFFLPVATVGLVLMAQEFADRRTRTAGAINRSASLISR